MATNEAPPPFSSYREAIHAFLQERLSTKLEKLKADDPRQSEVYKCGDYNTNLIKTAKGRTIMVQHNVSTPRPYDRINLVQGTKGVFRDYPSRIYMLRRI